jgi:hypothetical protein
VQAVTTYGDPVALPDDEVRSLVLFLRNYLNEQNNEYFVDFSLFYVGLR